MRVCVESKLTQTRVLDPFHEVSMGLGGCIKHVEVISTYEIQYN